MIKIFQLLLFILISLPSVAQDMIKRFAPFDPAIPSPKEFFGFEVGEKMIRHDQIVAYFEKLAQVSENANFTVYGQTYEGRKLVLLTLGSAKHLNSLEDIRKKHVSFNDTYDDKLANELPIIVNMGYSVHGNEPSAAESGVLLAYTMLASKNPDIKKYMEEAIIFFDPMLNPDGRGRFEQWTNSYKSEHLSADNDDVEHNEEWPRGRGNHYWFDLNRDWILGVHPESKSKLAWYHQWYPNVIGDFHEMGTFSSFFFEPMKNNGSANPIMPVENYTTLNDIFAKYFQKEMDGIGSLYFTKDVFDGTYPGYGSSYGDLQGGLALLFEQASSRGFVQNTPFGDLTFPFTIRNQYLSGVATIQAAVENKARLRKYQNYFFTSALKNAETDKVKAYIFSNDPSDINKTKEFVEKMLLHKVKMYQSTDGNSIIIPTKQAQYRIVQTAFEAYSEYRDSVFYDASAWSLANFYNIKFKGERSLPKLGVEIDDLNIFKSAHAAVKSDYAYLMHWSDLNSAGALNYLQSKGIVVASASKPFTIKTMVGKEVDFTYGSIVIPVAKQKESSDKIFELIKEVEKRFNINMHSVATGYSTNGFDLGSGRVLTLKQVKPLLIIGEGTSSLEAGEVWHHFDQKIKTPLTKIMTHRMRNSDLSKYNTLIMVSGDYSMLDSGTIQKIRNWTAEGNSLITIGSAVQWAINNKIVNEKLVAKPKEDSIVTRMPYDQASELIGRERLGGVILKSTIDLTHPLSYGYKDAELPVYKNNLVWLSQSKNPYSTVGVYPPNPHIDGFISKDIQKNYIPKAVSSVVSQVGRGRAILLTNNPLFRGSWYGTQKVFDNAVFLGSIMSVPSGGGNF
jgi:hypothetical protein